MSDEDKEPEGKKEYTPPASESIESPFPEALTRDEQERNLDKLKKSLEEDVSRIGMLKEFYGALTYDENDHRTAAEKRESRDSTIIAVLGVALLFISWSWISEKYDLPYRLPFSLAKTIFIIGLALIGFWKWGENIWKWIRGIFSKKKDAE